MSFFTAAYDPQPGDIIVAHLKVMGPPPSSPRWGFVKVDLGDCYGFVALAFVVGVHQQRPLQVGDSVLVNGDDTSTPKVVRGVFENQVWISNPAGHEFRTVTTNLLERVPQSNNPGI